MKRFILILFLLLAAREIRAFGLAGHAAIACIAEHHLTPRARTNIMRYTDHRSIVYYASWMDEWRRSKGYEFTTHWHAGTVDAEFRSTPAVREASGAKGDCVVAVEQSIALLSEYDRLDDSTVLVHIKYLVHLLGIIFITNGYNSIRAWFDIQQVRKETKKRTGEFPRISQIFFRRKPNFGYSKIRIKPKISKSR